MNVVLVVPCMPFMPAMVVPPLAMLSGGFPGIVLGLPLLVVASLVFAATHHEAPAAIVRATLQWMAWLGGILGGVLVVVTILGWFA
jgi:uncharacterized membrane protein YdcZ (DUF606 family)